MNWVIYPTDAPVEQLIRKEERKMNEKMNLKYREYILHGFLIVLFFLCVWQFEPVNQKNNNQRMLCVFSLSLRIKFVYFCISFGTVTFTYTFCLFIHYSFLFSLFISFQYSHIIIIHELKGMMPELQCSYIYMSKGIQIINKVYLYLAFQCGQWMMIAEVKRRKKMKQCHWTHIHNVSITFINKMNKRTTHMSTCSVCKGKGRIGARNDKAFHCIYSLIMFTMRICIQLCRWMYALWRNGLKREGIWENKPAAKWNCRKNHHSTNLFYQVDKKESEEMRETKSSHVKMPILISHSMITTS